MTLLDGRVTLISGGTQGVGAGIARAAVREGAQVVVTDRRRDVGERTAAETGATSIRADVSDVEGVRASAAAVVERYGRIDCGAGEIADFAVFLLSARSGVVTGSVIDGDQQVIGGTD